MISPLDNLTVFQNHNGIGIADRGKPVGNHQRGPIPHQPVHTVFDE